MNVRHIIAAALLSTACTTQPAVTDTTPTEQTVAAQKFVDDATEYPHIDVQAHTFQLDNGLTVVVHEDHKTPVVAVNVWYHVGSKDEKPGKTGFAHLFEHLMFQGSENFSGEYFEPLEHAGATDMNGTTNGDRTNYFQTVPTDALDLALWMESDRMGHFAGAISQELLDEQRGVVQNEMRQGQNTPYGKSREVLPQNSYPAGHPYSWTTIGSMDDLNAATLDDVKSWFGEYYGASNATVVLAGNITLEQAKEKAQRFFGHIAPGPEPVKLGPWVAPMTERRELAMFDRVPRERVYMLFNVPQYGTRALESLRAAALVLGSGKNSRLYKRLVYDDQIADNAYVYVLSREIGSQIYVIADARDGVDLAQVETAIEEELQRFAAEGPTLEELQRVKMRYFAGVVADSERVGGWSKANLLAQHQVFLGDAMAYQTIFNHLRTVGPAEVQRDAAQWMNENKLILRILPEPTYTTTASDVDRSQLPSTGEVPNLTLPPLQRATLSNGVRVILAERHDVPLVRISARFNVGHGSDHAWKHGTANFAMRVLPEGTESLSSLELAATLDRLGASLSTSAGLDWSYVTLSTLSNTLGESLDVMADVMQRPAFAEDEIERLRQQLLAGIAREKSQPYGNAMRLLGPLLYGDAHPYGAPLTGSGTEASVAAITREDLQSFHAAVVRPEAATILVVGDTKFDELLPELEQRFGSWAADGDAFAPTKATAPKQTAPRVILIDKPRAEQSLIIAGHVIPAFDKANHVELSLMNQALGGTFSARLNMNLREDKHWSYGARTFISATDQEQIFAAYAPVQTDKTAESMLEISKELNEIRTSRPITEAEQHHIVENSTRKLPGQNETTDALLTSVGTIVRRDLEDDYWNTYVDRVRGTTLDELNALAKSTITPEQLTWIVVGDLSKIREAVTSLNFGAVSVMDADGNVLE